jgi:hypothetical protein
MKFKRAYFGISFLLLTACGRGGGGGGLVDNASHFINNTVSQLDGSSSIVSSYSSNISKLQSDSMKIGWERKIDETSKWGITYSLPSRITRGSANLHVPYATTVDGEVIYQDVQTSLKQTSKEKNIGLYYASDGQEDTDWKTSLSIKYRQNVAGEEETNLFQEFKLVKSFKKKQLT